MDGNQYLDQVTVRSLVGTPEAALDHVMAKAYQLYQAGRYPQVEILCRGLIACDHKYWWSYSLYASALRKMGRYGEALRQLDAGLRYEPGQPKLLAMRDELRAALDATAPRAQAPAPASTPSHADRPAGRAEVR